MDFQPIAGNGWKMIRRKGPSIGRFVIISSIWLFPLEYGKSWFDPESWKDVDKSWLKDLVVISDHCLSFGVYFIQNVNRFAIFLYSQNSFLLFYTVSISILDWLWIDLNLWSNDEGKYWQCNLVHVLNPIAVISFGDVLSLGVDSGWTVECRISGSGIINPVIRGVLV